MEDIKKTSGMTSIVKTITRFVFGFTFIFGCYIATSGHFSPGGGFAGGVIVALALIQLMLVFGKDTALKKLNLSVAGMLISSAALILLFVIASNILSAGSFAGRILSENSAFFQFFGLEIIIPLCTMVVVSTAVFTAFVALVLIYKSDK